MDLKDIQELIKFVAKSGATEVDLEIENIKISIKSPAKKRRGEDDEIKTIIQQVPAQVVATPVAAPVAAPVATPVTQESTPNSIKPSENLPVDQENSITIKASMIGTFYRSSSPEIPPFVNVGDIIKEGDPICIIEAMKLFNEIESEVSGKIIKVLVDDTTPVEFDQPLFLVEPS
tara:strand:+ start:392 stop:916 length:525 start_codon:yes stop_codon:yes gene_type:complete